MFDNNRLDESFSKESLYKSLNGHNSFEVDYSKISIDKDTGEIFVGGPREDGHYTSNTIPIFKSFIHSPENIVGEFNFRTEDAKLIADLLASNLVDLCPSGIVQESHIEGDTKVITKFKLTSITLVPTYVETEKKND